MDKITRAKFVVTDVDRDEADGSARFIKLEAVTAYDYDDPSEENVKFFDATPYGELSMGVVNKPAAEPFEVGREFYLDFIPVEG